MEEFLMTYTRKPGDALIYSCAAHTECDNPLVQLRNPCPFYECLEYLIGAGYRPTYIEYAKIDYSANGRVVNWKRGITYEILVKKSSFDGPAAEMVNIVAALRPGFPVLHRGVRYDGFMFKNNFDDRNRYPYLAVLWCDVSLPESDPE